MFKKSLILYLALCVVIILGFFFFWKKNSETEIGYYTSSLPVPPSPYNKLWTVVDMRGKDFETVVKQLDKRYKNQVVTKNMVYISPGDAKLWYIQHDFRATTRDLIKYREYLLSSGLNAKGVVEISHSIELYYVLGNGAVVSIRQIENSYPIFPNSSMHEVISSYKRQKWPNIVDFARDGATVIIKCDNMVRETEIMASVQYALGLLKFRKTDGLQQQKTVASEHSCFICSHSRQ